MEGRSSQEARAAGVCRWCSSHVRVGGCGRVVGSSAQSPRLMVSAIRPPSAILHSTFHDPLHTSQEGAKTVADGYSRYEYDVYSGTCLGMSSTALNGNGNLLLGLGRALGLVKKPGVAAIHEFVLQVGVGARVQGKRDKCVWVCVWVCACAYVCVRESQQGQEEIKTVYAM